MLPYIAVSDHYTYTTTTTTTTDDKSNMLQQMSKLLTQHPNVQKHFSKGLHVIQRNIHFHLHVCPCHLASFDKLKDPVEVSPENYSKLAPFIATINACLSEVNQAMQKLTKGLNTTLGAGQGFDSGKTNT